MKYCQAFEEGIRKTEISVLVPEPLVVVAFEQVFWKQAETFARQAELSPGMSILLQVGWSHTPEHWAEITDSIKAHLKRFPQNRIVILTNTEEDAALLHDQGVEAIFCNHNAFIDPRRIPAFRTKKLFDAAYLARLSPFKRYELLEKSEKLLLLAVRARAKEAWYEERMQPLLKRSTWIRRFPGLCASTVLAPARCGVCLSALEGAMYSSFEYLLAGLPIVNVPNVGGRDATIPSDYVKMVEGTPEGVAEGIRYWREHPVDPQAVHDAAVALVAPHQARLRALLDEILAPRRYTGRFPHKLGVRVPQGVRNSTPFIWGFGLVQRLLRPLLWRRIVKKGRW